MAEPNITGGGGTDPFSSVTGAGSGGVSSKGINRVTAAVKALNQELRVTEKLTQGIGKVRGAFGNIGGGIAGSGGTANAGYITANMGNPTTSSRTSYIMDAVRSGGGAGGGGGGGGFTQLLGGMGGGPAGMKGDAFSAVGGAIGGAIGAVDKSLDARIARGYEYSSAADKMAVMYQQIMGVSNREYRKEYREPLTQKYMLLGMGGANELLAMQARTGINAQQQAKSIEAMRVLSGFSITAGQGAQMVTELGSAQTANRMLMTSGISLYKPGGGQRSSMEVIQQLARSAGLLDRSGKDLEGALVQGSRTRTTLSYMGIGSDMQDQVIQYAMANSQFKDKVGGKGANGNQLYDPSNKEHRKVMGIQDNFALQQEVTESFKVNREERFYGRQTDNFAALERRTQNLTEAFAALEDRLSGLIGQDIKYQNEKKLLKGAGKFLGPALSVAGMAAAFTPAAPLAPFLMGAGALVTGASGDPPETPQPPANASSQTTFPTHGKPATLDKIKSNPKFQKLHPQLRDRLTKLMVASGGRVGFGGGWRSSAEQERLFLSRYTPTDEVTDIQWNGQYYKHTSGDPAAPPGRSMHELGLAADLAGDMGWLRENAHRFGLKHFGDVNGEDYHVQPAELPNSRRKYEEAGAPWGTDGEFKPGDKFGEKRGRSADAMERDAHGGGGGLTITAFRGLTQSEMIDSFVNSNRLNGLSNPGGGPARATAGRGRRRGMTTQASPLIGGGQSLDPKSLVSILRANGWGPQLTEAVGVTWRESRWNPRSHNDSFLRGGRDDSYGLFQINMNPNETSAEANRKAWGIPNNEALYDPGTNSRIAREMFNDRGWNPWGPGGTQFRGVDLAAAAATVREADRTGDPMVPSMASSGGGGGGGSHMNVVGGTTINIAPTINIQATNNPTADYEQAAKQVTMLLEKEARRYLMRSY